MYQLIRSVLFLLPAETAHTFSMSMLKFICSIRYIHKSIANKFSKDTYLPFTAFGLKFNNLVGMAAGFDKNAVYLKELETIGFGFIEIGTITPKPQAGNLKPRLFRLPKDNALINRMGFNNDGVEVIAERLKNWKSIDQRQKHHHKFKHRIIIGGNIGKNKDTSNEDAWQDYEICFNKLHPYVDFFIINVSSPNTPGLRELQEKKSLGKILSHLQQLNSLHDIQRPILLKIAPDLNQEQLDDIIALATEIKIDGLVATNTTISREGLTTNNKKISKIGGGGLSGLPLKQRSNEIISYIHQKTGGTIPIIGSGGIFTGADALQKLNAGANMVEVWTGFIYKGPFIVKNICKQLSTAKTN